jgi:hypothetical protein
MEEIMVYRRIDILCRFIKKWDVLSSAFFFCKHVNKEYIILLGKYFWHIVFLQVYLIRWVIIYSLCIYMISFSLARWRALLKILFFVFLITSIFFGNITFAQYCSPAFSYTEFDTSNRWTTDLEIWDLDGDGDLDIITVEQLYTNGQGFPVQWDTLIFWNDGNWVYTEEDVSSDLWLNSEGVSLVDIDLDGDLDVKVWEENKVHLNNGSGQFNTFYTMQWSNW